MTSPVLAMSCPSHIYQQVNLFPWSTVTLKSALELRVYLVHRVVRWHFTEGPYRNWGLIVFLSGGISQWGVGGKNWGRTHVAEIRKLEDKDKMPKWHDSVRYKIQLWQVEMEKEGIQTRNTNVEKNISRIWCELGFWLFCTCFGIQGKPEHIFKYWGKNLLWQGRF